MPRFQGLYYLVSGLWPLLSRRTFEAVTGPKTDFWLVRTVGLLAMVLGLALAKPRSADAGPEAVVGVGGALAFAVVDLNYVLRRRISPIYLGDAFVEMLFGAWWLGRLLSRRRR